MKVAINLADIILDTTSLYREGIKSRMEDGVAKSELDAYKNTLFESTDIALARGNFFNEELINALKPFTDIEFFILCSPHEEFLCYEVSNILQDKYNFIVEDAYSCCLDEIDSYLEDLDISVLITNDSHALGAACDCVENIICYGMHEVRLPVSFTQDVTAVVKRLKEMSNCDI